ncbi:MAG: hypothetical protein M3345_07590 [Actinomycetota bacterium]|nr:hypothetical protein [Actinomycetota bacterium]
MKISLYVEKGVFMKNRFPKVAALALAATMVIPAGSAVADPAAAVDGTVAQECLFGVTAQEAGLAEQINAFRETKGRSQLNLDQVLTVGAEVVSIVQGTEGKGDVHKVRIRTRNQLLQNFVSVGAIAMKKSSMQAVWRDLTKNSYARSIIMRKVWEHTGVSVEEYNGKTFVVIIFGGEILTPLSC